MKRKQQDSPLAATACQLRGGQTHPFGALRGFVPLGAGEEMMYRQLREAIPVLDAAVGKLVRLSGGFDVRCRSEESGEKLRQFLRYVPCGRGQVHRYGRLLLFRLLLRFEAYKLHMYL